MPSVLVTINGGPDDEAALRAACQMARQGRARVLAVHVIEIPRVFPLDADLPEPFARGEALLQWAEVLAAEAGVVVQAELLQARDAGVAIVDEAAERQADLLVLGVAHKRRRGQYELGRTVRFVLEHAPCPVWLVRTAPPPEPLIAAPQSAAAPPAQEHALLAG